MSTRCHVGYIENGELLAVYSHWDGYPQKTLRCLLTFIKNEGIKAFMFEVKRGCLEGGIRSWSDVGAVTYGDLWERTEDLNWAVRERSGLDNNYGYIFDASSGELAEAYEWGKRIPVNEMIELSGYEDS